MTRNPDPATYDFLYAEAKRSIEQQQGVLNELRGRAATLLSAAAIVTGFLGGIALGDKHIGTFGSAAIAVFAIVGFLLVGLLIPLAGWNFRWNAHDLLSKYVEDPAGPATMAEMQRGLANWAEDDYHLNNNRMSKLWWVFRGAAGLLVFDVLLWLFELSS